MKKNILLACSIALAACFTACSGDYEDATSKHVYSATDPVYINTAVGAQAGASLEFPTTKITETQSVPLSDYNDLFKEQFNMSADQVIAAINSGELQLKAISVARGQWTVDAPNNGKGWYFDINNKPCAKENAIASASINESKKTIDVNVDKNAAAGTQLALNFGIAKRNAQWGTYDNYVRFQYAISVTDPTIIMATFDMAEGDYTGYEFFFYDDYDAQFQACLNMTAQEALNGLEDGTVGFYVTDAAGKIYEQDYTADAGDGYYGYWMNDKAEICNWGAGAAIYCDAELGERALWFGRYPDIASWQDTQMTVYLKMALTSDPSKFIRFIITLNL